MFISVITSARLETQSRVTHTLCTKHKLMSNFTCYPFITCSQVTQNTFSIYIYSLTCPIYWPHDQVKLIYTSDKVVRLTGTVRVAYVDRFISTWNLKTAALPLFNHTYGLLQTTYY